MKTTKEWIDELPEDIREMAYIHTENDILEDLEPSLFEAILGAFVWDEKIEKNRFWHLVAKGEFDQARTFLANQQKTKL